MRHLNLGFVSGGGNAPSEKVTPLLLS